MTCDVCKKIRPTHDIGLASDGLKKEMCAECYKDRNVLMEKIKIDFGKIIKACEMTYWDRVKRQVRYMIIRWDTIKRWVRK